MMSFYWNLLNWAATTLPNTTKVTDDTPFKEQFRQITPTLVEEVHNHLRENQVLYDPVRVHGVMQLCWSEGKMEAYASVLTSTI